MYSYDRRTAKYSDNLSRDIGAIAQGMPQGDWGNARQVLGKVEDLFGTHNDHSFSIDAEWFYALGPKQARRAKDTLVSTRKLKGLIGDANSAIRNADDMKALAREVQWLETLLKGAKQTLKLDQFEVLPTEGVSQTQVSDAVEALRQAAKHIKSKFPQVLYGKVFVTQRTPGHNSVASYVSDLDVVYLSVKAQGTVGDVHTICHELGHRFFYKFWKDREQKNQFMDLSSRPKYEEVVFDAALRKKMADEFLEVTLKQKDGKKVPISDTLSLWLKHQMKANLNELRATIQKALQGDEASEAVLHKAMQGSEDVTMKTDKVVGEPEYVTPYGAKNWGENFAEAFAHYVMGKSLPPGIAEIVSHL